VTAGFDEGKTPQLGNINYLLRWKTKEDTMSKGAATILSALAILVSGFLITGAQAGSAQSSAPSKYNGQSKYNAIATVQYVGITEFSSSSAHRAKHRQNR
jgi:hypothetical protein